MKRIKKGFTLTELLISIGVLAVIAAIAIPLTIGIMNKGSETSEDVNTALYTSIMNKYAAEKVEEADVYPRLTTVGTEAEYPMFAEKAGQGSFPGFNVIAGVDTADVITQIRKEAVIAIKAFSDTPVSDDYFISPPSDADYEYVYYYLTGEVKKVKREDLSVTSAEDLLTGQINTKDYWVYLSRNGGSSAALGGVSNGVGHLFVRVLQFGTDEPLIGATVKVMSGAKTFTAVTEEGQNGFVGFSGIPEGAVSISISYTGAISFPDSTYYSKNGEIIISPSGYEGCQMNVPYTVKLKLGSLGTVGFYKETVEWNGEDWNENREYITDSVVATTDFSINTGKNGGYPRNESYLTNLSQTNGVLNLLEGDKFLTYGHYHMNISAFGYRIHREDVEATVFGLSDYSGRYDGFSEPYEYAVILRSPAGEGKISGTIECEREEQPLYGYPEGLIGTLPYEDNFDLRAWVRLTNVETYESFYSSEFYPNEDGKYDYEISGLPDGEYYFEIDSPYYYYSLDKFPETVTIDGREVIVSGKVEKDKAEMGGLYGWVYYDLMGNYDPLPNTLISLTRFGDTELSYSVYTDEWGYFETTDIINGFYQMTVELPAELGGNVFYYKLFVSGYNYVDLMISVPTVTVKGYIYPFLNSEFLDVPYCMGDLEVYLVRTNSDGSYEYSYSYAIVDYYSDNCEYEIQLPLGYYYMVIDATCFYTEVTNIVSLTDDWYEDRYVYIDENDPDNHYGFDLKSDADEHWYECYNCKYAFYKDHHYESAWTYYSEGGCYKYCLDCGYELYYEPHSFESYVSVAATCTAKGERTYYCSKGCGYSYTETIKASGHKGNGVWVYDSNGSASSVGTHHQNCSNCGTIMNSGSSCYRSGYYNYDGSYHYDYCTTCYGRRYFYHSWYESWRSGYACTGGTIYYNCYSCSATKTGSYAATASHNQNARCTTKHAASFTSGCSAGGTHKWNGYYHILCSVCGRISNSSSKWCAMHVSSSKVQKPCPA